MIRHSMWTKTYARCIFLLSFHLASHLCWLGMTSSAWRGERDIIHLTPSPLSWEHFCSISPQIFFPTIFFLSAQTFIPSHLSPLSLHRAVYLSVSQDEHLAKEPHRGQSCQLSPKLSGQNTPGFAVSFTATRNKSPWTKFQKFWMPHGICKCQICDFFILGGNTGAVNDVSFSSSFFQIFSFLSKQSDSQQQKNFLGKKESKSKLICGQPPIFLFQFVFLPLLWSWKVQQPLSRNGREEEGLMILLVSQGWFASFQTLLPPSSCVVSKEKERLFGVWGGEGGGEEEFFNPNFPARTGRRN